jgi:hypothetical protein
VVCFTMSAARLHKVYSLEMLNYGWSMNWEGFGRKRPGRDWENPRKPPLSVAGVEIRTEDLQNTGLVHYRMSQFACSPTFHFIHIWGLHVAYRFFLHLLSFYSHWIIVSNHVTVIPIGPY